jgi:hypothetical protein
MMTPSTIQTGGKLKGWAIPATFWGVFAACLYLWIHPHLIYTAFGRLLPYPSFELTGDFAVRSLGYPVGVADYLSGFLSQGLSAPVMAAAVITAVAMGVSAGMGRIPGAASGSARAIGAYVPALMILMAYARFSHPMTSCLSLAISVWAAVLLRRMRFRRAGLDLALFAFCAAAVYWIGGGGVWVFGVLLAMDSVRRKAMVAGLAMLVLTAGIAMGLGIGLEGWPAAKALLYPMPFGPGWGLDFRNVPLGAIQILWLWPIVIGLMDLAAGIAISGKYKSKLTPSIPGSQSWKRTVVTGLLLGAAVPLSALASYDPLSALQLRIIHLGRQGRWADLLDCARDLPPNAYNLYLNHEIDRALAHTGQMGERLCAFTQSPLGLLLSAPATEGEPEPTYNIDLLIELGCVNLAEHAAMEILEVKGNLPFVLEWLARIYTVKGSPETAAVFLNRLAAIPAHRGQARRLLAQLANDPEMKNDGQIRWLRACNPQKDLVTFDLGPEGLFDYLLERNASNRMAWDYRMAVYLLTQQVDKVASHLRELEAFGATSLPRHYAEALAIYRARGGQAVPLGGFELPTEIEERARVFLATFQQFRGDRALAMRTLAKDYGDSYFYYYTFGVSGVKE